MVLFNLIFTPNSRRLANKKKLFLINFYCAQMLRVDWGYPTSGDYFSRLPSLRIPFFTKYYII